MDKFTVRGKDGSVDVSASANAYAKALVTWCTENEVDSETIETAVETVFDRFLGQVLPMPALLDLAVQELDVEPAQHKAMTTRVHAYVTGQCSNNTGRINVGKGKGGGVSRLALPGEEIPARPAKKTA